MRKGIIKSFNKKKAIGIITDENEQDIMFYLKSFVGLIKINLPVSFRIIMFKNKLIADSIKPLPIIGLDSLSIIANYY